MTQTGVITWSQTASSNSTADDNINWAEGMAPSQVNDSARAMMASVAKWRDDNNGLNTTSGGPVSYTYTSQQNFSSFAAMDEASFDIVFTVTNGTNPTLNVDGLGAISIFQGAFGTGNAIPPGWLVALVPYQLTYSNGGSAFYVRNLSTANFLPVAMIASFPNSYLPDGWLVCNGQAVSRTTYANLFAVISTTYGSTSSGTFNLPNVTTFGIPPLIKT